jgi:predicted acetyltransferase
VARLADESDSAKPLDTGRVHCTYRWIVEGDRVLGAIALRHELNDFLLRAGGHIGYGIRPSARRRGLATWALGRMLGEARVLGLDRVLIICEVDNIASAKTIERHGGVLEDVRDTELGTVRRYWIKI